MVRHNNQLPDNLPQLQNLIKRDSESYKEEFLQQHSHYKSTLEIFRTSPDKFHKGLDELVTFLAQVAHCYTEDLATFPQEIIDILKTHGTRLDNEMRMTFCKVLILLRNKVLLEPITLLSLFFDLLRCQDKALREFLKNHIIQDIKNVNSKNKNPKVNTALQNFMYSALKDTNTRAAKMSTDIMVELYKKNVWNDAKTVNVLATGCLCKTTKVMVSCLKFFLGTDPDEKDDSDSDDDTPTVKDVMMANKVNKSSKKREKQLKKVKKLVVKSKKKKSKAPQFNFSALHLIHDPQGFAENLFQQLRKNNDRFEIKLMTVDVISRLIGLHNLFLLNFYPYIQRFLRPHQREVTKLLQCIAQASHELVPPEVLEPLVKTLIDNFVTECNSADVIAIGLNAIREICSRCPLVMTKDRLQDLVEFKKHRERSVMMAARSLIGLYRTAIPELLHRDDRGRPTEATAALQDVKYGDLAAPDFIKGAEVLLEAPEDDESDSEGSWVDVSHSEDDDSCSEDEISEDSSEKVVAKPGIRKKNKRTKLQRKKEKMERLERMKKVKKEEFTAEKKEKAAQISVQRILTDEDFKRIDSELIKQQITPAKRGVKRPLEDESRGELVKLGDIENIYKKRKHDKQTRLQSVQSGRDDREKFGYKDGRQNPLCSKTNREKRKTKAFQMVKHKIKSKVKRSFKDKQISLRNHLLKQRRMK